ncbi:hypothetical protein GE09DRAFT_1111226 [Coniochaeta sp. 2T2.1]|nr:hypothetical protein GE09DRAFT_1111226 [Coniochaeta sp. 2T2.1]
MRTRSDLREAIAVVLLCLSRFYLPASFCVYPCLGVPMLESHTSLRGGEYGIQQGTNRRRLPWMTYHSGVFRGCPRTISLGLGLW